MKTGRPTTLATQGMVTTPHYLASIAGLRTLQAGGNAVDAAIAANAVLTVVYPHMCSIGGDAFFLIWDPAAGRLAALNGSGRSPNAASIESVQAAGFNEMPKRGALTVTVPGAVSAWETVLERYGTRSFIDLLQPAISYAAGGFPISPILSSAIAANRELLERQSAAAAIFLPGGRMPDAGDILRQPDLAASLRLVATRGSSAIYTGALGERIVQTLRANGSAMTLDDLSAHQPEWVQPLSTSYRGIELIELPPNTQGVTALEMVNISEGWPVSELGSGSARLVHLGVEAKKLAFADRDRYIGDPAMVDVPVDRLISKEYAAELRGQVDSERATVEEPDPAGGGDTVYLCAVDRDGMAVSLIQSLFNGFGSGLVAEGAGIVMQNRGASFTLEAGAANGLAGGKRPLHTLIPAMLLRDGLPWTVFGAMGGHGQAQTHLQLVHNLVDFVMEPQAAIEAPRGLAGRGIETDPLHLLQIEPEFGETVIEQLEKLGHPVRVTGSFSSLMGHAQIIQLDRRRGILLGGSDPRADGYALGW